MKFFLAVLTLGFLIIGPATAEELAKFSLDDASQTGLRIEADSKEKVEGKGSLKISTLWPTTVCLGEVSGLNVENTALDYLASVKSELENNGAAYLEMWVQVGSGQYFSRGLNETVKGRTDWKTLRTYFVLKQGQKAERVTLNIVINGRGTVWVDGLVLKR